MNERRVAVIGGGITGLAAADHLLRLARAAARPLAVTLLEAGPRLGGKVRTVRSGGMVLELGPDSFLARKAAASRWAENLGLGGELVHENPAARKLYVVHAGRLHPLPPGLAMGIPMRPKALLASGLLSWRGKLRALLEPWIPPRRDDVDESIAAFARRRLGREAAERIAEPFLKAPYAGRAADLSVMATFPQLRELERRHGSLVRGLRQRAAATAVPPPMFTTVRSGLERLIEAAAARLATARVVLGTPVQRLEPAPGQRWRLWTAGGPGAVFDGVIVAAPAPAAARLLEPFCPEAAVALGQIAYADVGVAALLYARSEVPHPLDGSGVLVPESERLALTGCAWLSSKWPHTCPPDHALLRCFFVPERYPEGQDEELLADLARDLGRLLGIASAPQAHHIVRWRQAIPQYAPGHLDRVATIERALADHPRLRLAGAALRGIGLPDCVQQGQAAAEQLFYRL